MAHSGLAGKRLRHDDAGLLDAFPVDLAECVPLLLVQRSADCHRDALTDDQRAIRTLGNVCISHWGPDAHNSLPIWCYIAVKNDFFGRDKADGGTANCCN